MSTMDVVARGLGFKALTQSQAALDAVTSVAAQVALEGGPSLLIKPGTGTFPAVADSYFPGRKSLYSNFDGIRRQLRAYTDVMDLVRAGTATYFASTGLQVTAPNNIARLEYEPSTLALRGLLSEPQRTNLLLGSNSLASAPWLGAATATPAGAVGADGSLSLFKVEDTSASVVEERVQTFTAGGVGNHTVSFNTLMGTTYPSVRMSGPGHTELILDPVNRQAQWRSGNIGVNWYVKNLGGGLTRYFVVIANPTGSNITIILRAAFASTYSPTIDAAATGYTYFGDVQVELGEYGTSYIPTPTTGSASRIADQYSKPLGVEYNPAATSMMGRVRFDHSPADGATKVVQQFDDGTANNRLTVMVSSAGVLQFQSIVGGAVTGTVVGPTLAANIDYKFTAGFSAGVLRLSVNGTSYAEAAPTALPAGLTTRRFMSGAAGGSQPGAWLMPYLPHPTNPLLDATEFPRLMTAAEMQVYTA